MEEKEESPTSKVNPCGVATKRKSGEEYPPADTRPPRRPRYNFSLEYIEYFLYGYNNVLGVKPEAFNENLSRSPGHPRDCCCEVCLKNATMGKTKRDPLNSLQKFVNGEKSKSQTKMTYAMESFPDEVELLPSTIPGLKCGVFAKVPIAVGTWIGPFEGKRIKPEDITKSNATDTSFIWEMFEKGKLVGFLDASDEEESSWMRFIRCARHSWEQNLYLFQHNGEIYYRAFRDISPGVELLVWYDASYSQHFGIPLGLDISHDAKNTGPTGEYERIFLPQLPKEFPHSSSRLGVSVGPQSSKNRSPIAIESTKLLNYLESHQLLYNVGEKPGQEKGRFAAYLSGQEGRSAVALDRSQAHLFPAKQKGHQQLQAQQTAIELKPQLQQTGSNVKDCNLYAFDSTTANERVRQKLEPFVDSKRDEEFELFRRDLKRKLQKKREQKRERDEEESRNHNMQDHSPKQSSKPESTEKEATLDKHPLQNEAVAPVLDTEKMQTAREIQSQAKAQESPGRPLQLPGSVPHPEDVGQRNFNGVSVHDTPPQSPDGKCHLKHEHLVVKAPVHEEKSTAHGNENQPAENNVWKCGQCKKTFSQRTTLQVHICTRSPEKPYQCGHCYLSFAKPGALKNHVITHANEKPFQCGFCSRAFSGATTLNNHIRTHTGEKPFSCEKCGKFFSQASQLSRHHRIPSDCVI